MTRMSTDSLIGKYVGSTISTDYLISKYLGFSIVRTSLVYVCRVCYVRAFRFDFSYTSSRIEATSFNQTQVSTVINIFFSPGNIFYGGVGWPLDERNDYFSCIF